MFRVLGAELEIAQAGITSAREAAVYSYAADRLAKGENATAERLLNVFDHKVIRDATMTGLFYARCDGERLKQAGVAQGIGGVWVDSEQKAEKTYAEIRYRVKPANVLTKPPEFWVWVIPEVLSSISLRRKEIPRQSDSHAPITDMISASAVLKPL